MDGGLSEHSYDQFCPKHLGKKETKKEAVEKVVVAKPNPDQKYLQGAVPLVDGKVVFSKTFDAQANLPFNYIIL